MPLWLEKPPAIIIPKPPEIRRAMLPGIIPVFNTGRIISTPVSIGNVGAGAGPNPITLTTTAAIPAGATVVVCIGAGHSTTESHVTAVSDGTNTYSLGVASVWNSGSGALAEIWYKTNAAAVSSSATISITFSQAPQAFNTGIAAAYVTGVSTLDKTSANSLSSGTNTSSGSSGTLTVPTEVAFGWCYTPGTASTITEDANFTRLATQSNPNLDLAYDLTHATTALNYQPVQSIAGNSWNNCLVTFK